MLQFNRIGMRCQVEKNVPISRGFLHRSTVSGCSAASASWKEKKETVAPTAAAIAMGTQFVAE